MSNAASMNPAAPAGYQLTLKSGRSWTDPRVLRPDVLCELTPEGVRERLGDAFEIQGTPGDHLDLHGMSVLDGIGAHMTHGTLVVHGPVGDELGASMTGGLIRVHGEAGHRVGGPAVQGDNARRGMTGGSIIIHGDAGDHLGLRMRRGVIAVTGRVGQSPGYRMIAGTIAIGQGDLQYPGLEMQRGTLLCLDPSAQCNTGESFETDNTFDAPAMAILGLLLAHLTKLGMPITDAMRQGQWQLSSGDRFELGKGELWQWKH